MPRANEKPQVRYLPQEHRGTKRAGGKKGYRRGKDLLQLLMAAATLFQDMGKLNLCDEVVECKCGVSNVEDVRI